MGFTELPTQTDESLGRPKVDLRPPVDLDHNMSAAEWTRIQQTIITLAEAVGLEDGSTTGSILEALAALGVGVGIGNGRRATALDAAVEGVTPVNVGHFYLASGTLLGTSRVFAGALSVAPDGFTLELRRETGATLITSWTGTGLMADRVLGADVAIPAPDWYSLSLRASGAAVTAVLLGIDLTVV